MKNKSTLLLLILVLVKLIISIPYLNTNSIDLDEPFSIFHAQNSISGLLEIFQTENNPPAHFILLHFWEQLFGISPAAVRSLSLLFSVCTIFILWKIGNRYFSERNAIAVVLLFIFSDFHQYHSLEARTYSLFVLEFSILIYFILKILIEKNATKMDFFYLGLINAALFYTHYIFPFVLVAEAILLLIYIRKFKIAEIAIICCTFFLSIAPWLTTIFNRISSVKSSGTWLSKAQFSEIYGLFNKFLNDKWSMLTLLLVIGFLFVIKRSTLLAVVKENAKLILILSILIIVPYSLAFGLSRLEVVDLFYDRYLFFLTIPLFFIISLFFQNKDSIYTLSFALFFAVFLFRFNLQPENNRNANEIAAFVKDSQVNEIVIAPDYYDMTFLYHYDQKLFKNTSMRSLENGNGIYPIKTREDLDSIPFKTRIALIDAAFEFVNPNQNLGLWFVQHGFSVESKQYFKGNYSVSIYTK